MELELFIRKPSSTVSSLPQSLIPLSSGWICVVLLYLGQQNIELRMKKGILASDSGLTNSWLKEETSKAMPFHSRDRTMKMGSRTDRQQVLYTRINIWIQMFFHQLLPILCSLFSSVKITLQLDKFPNRRNLEIHLNFVP